MITSDVYGHEAGRHTYPLAEMRKQAKEIEAACTRSKGVWVSQNLKLLALFYPKCDNKNNDSNIQFSIQ